MALEPQALTLAESLSRLPPLGEDEITAAVPAIVLPGPATTGFVGATRRALAQQAAFNVKVGAVIDGGVPPTGPAQGDLTGEYPAPQIADGVITVARVAPSVLNAPGGLVQLDAGAQVPAEQTPFLSPGQWQDDAQPPAGTRATPYLPILPPTTSAKLKSLTYWNALAPGAGETLTLRVYKYLAGGSGFVLMTDPIVVNNTYADFTTVDVSSAIRNLFWAQGDVLALSRVYVSPSRLQAPLISWQFELVPCPETPAAGTTVAGTWPPTP